MAFWVRFWGTRGSIACPSSRHVTYGGNTSCIEIIADDHRVVLDAGTGIRELGQEFMDKDIREAHILLTHTHWDHINGFPFFKPLFDSRRRFRVMAGHLGQHEEEIRDVLAGQMTKPMFPVPIETLRADMDYVDFVHGDGFEVGPVKVKTAPLNHPDGATGYRLEYQGKSVCYVTDTEHLPGKPDQNVLGLIEGADLVIYDSTYTDEEFPTKVGWGHSTWQEGVRLCQAAHVKQLAIFHHDPDHHDEFMAQVEKDAKAMWSGATVARENTIVKLVP